MGLDVTGEYLAEAAAACDSTASNVQEQLTALQAFVVNMETYYQSFAAGAFQILMNDWNTCSISLNDALTTIAAGIRTNWANYAQGDQQALTNIHNIQAELPLPNLG
jgi:WXG100 family type VII secretion target